MDESELGGTHAEIARLARDMHSSIGEINPDDVLFEVTEAAIRILPGVNHAGVALVEGHKKKLHSTAATGPVPKTVDILQERYAQGPCLDALWEHHTVRVNDYGFEHRWPDFAAALLIETAVRSSLSIQLFTHESELGALNLYSDQTDTFTPQMEELASALAAHAAIGLSGARRSRQFQTALASRDMIGQAKGMIMERYRVNAIAAFRLLVRVSQEQNTPIVEIARRIVHKDFPPNLADHSTEQKTRFRLSRAGGLRVTTYGEGGDDGARRYCLTSRRSLSATASRRKRRNRVIATPRVPIGCPLSGGSKCDSQNWE